MLTLKSGSTSLLALALAGCVTNPTARDYDPIRTVQSALSIDKAVACVVESASANNPWNYAFRAQVASPGQVYEVHPTREIMIGAEPVFFSIEKAGTGSRITVHTIPRFRSEFSQSVTDCA